MNTSKLTFSEIRERLLAEHNIAFGVFGTPEGSSWTYSYEHFFREAMNHNIITKDEYEEFHKQYRIVWHNSLSD